jgi:hypothetical protein
VTIFAASTVAGPSASASKLSNSGRVRSSRADPARCTRLVRIFLLRRPHWPTAWPRSRHCACHGGLPKRDSVSGLGVLTAYVRQPRGKVCIERMFRTFKKTCSGLWRLPHWTTGVGALAYFRHGITPAQAFESGRLSISCSGAPTFLWHSAR